MKVILLLICSFNCRAQDSYSASKPRIDFAGSKKEQRKGKLKNVWYAIRPKGIKIAVHVKFKK